MTITKELGGMQDNNTETLSPEDLERIKIALRKQINIHHSQACQAHTTKDQKRIDYHTNEYQEYCILLSAF